MTYALSVFFTTLPAMLWLVIAYLFDNGDYYWPVYHIAGGIFLAVSLILGILGPARFAQAWNHRPWLSIFIQGLLAWVAAVFVLGLLNLTPMCVGQDNGDGSNNLALCVVQTVLVGIAYTPVELLFLLPGMAITGLVLRNRRA